MRAMAAELGMAPSSYAFYEDTAKFKKPFLPVPFVRSLLRPLTERGIKAEAILALGGAQEFAEDSDVDAVGEPRSLTPRQRALLLSAEGATDEQFIKASEFLRGQVDAIDASASAAQQLDAVLLPEIDVAYSMGAGTDIADYPVTRLVPFSRSWLDALTRSPTSKLFVARGEGDSMMPTILDQDIVIIDRSEQQLRSQDRIWAINYGGFGMIKRLRALPSGSLQINSDNPAVTPIEAFDGEAHIIGRVVGIVRRV